MAGSLPIWRRSAGCDPWVCRCHFQSRLPAASAHSLPQFRRRGPVPAASASVRSRQHHGDKRSCAALLALGDSHTQGRRPEDPIRVVGVLPAAYPARIGDRSEDGAHRTESMSLTESPMVKSPGGRCAARRDVVRGVGRIVVLRGSEKPRSCWMTSHRDTSDGVYFPVSLQPLIGWTDVPRGVHSSTRA